MKLTFNLTSGSDDLDRFENRAALIDLMRGFDGVELMQLDDDVRGIIPAERVIGFHMSFLHYWLDFWKGDFDAVCKEFGAIETAYQVYGGSNRNAILDHYRRDLANAHRWNPEYVVFHVSDAGIEESFKLKYHHSDEEVIDATIELLNELFADEDGTIALLVENLWQPGLSFTRPEMTRRLMEGIRYPNKGIMLDTGHLLHTNLQLRTQEEGVSYIHSLLDMHGELCQYIRGVHLNQSLTGEYMEQTMRNPPDLSGSYSKRCEKMFWHAFAIDRHLPFTCAGVSSLIHRISPEYLTFEFITTDQMQHREYLSAQFKALEMLKKG